MSTLPALLKELEARPFPRLGRSIGDFPLYDSLLAGAAERASNSAVQESPVPEADEATLAEVQELRGKPTCSVEEREFLEYFDLLEKIRQEISKQAKND